TTKLLSRRSEIDTTVNSYRGRTAVRGYVARGSACVASAGSWSKSNHTLTASSPRARSPVPRNRCVVCALKCRLLGAFFACLAVRLDKLREERRAGTRNSSVSIPQTTGDLVEVGIILKDLAKSSVVDTVTMTSMYHKVLALIKLPPEQRSTRECQELVDWLRAKSKILANVKYGKRRFSRLF
ncbi:hypothetical protein BaRGS_00029780, partial [Batillaria attramentaria]